MLNEKGLFTYEITPLTMAIIGKEGKNGAAKSYVIEEEFEYTVFATPTALVDNACKFYGSSLAGAREGTRNISNITHKAPISIEPASGMYFFPTTSPMKKTCSWLSHTHIKSIEPLEKGSITQVTFKNGKKLILDISFGSMVNQQNRTAQYRFTLDSRMKSIADMLLTQEMIAEKRF